MPRYQSEVSARSLNNQMAGRGGYDNVESSHHRHDDDDDESDEGFAADRRSGGGGGGRGGGAGGNKPMTTSNRCGAICGGAHKWRLLFIILTVILLALTGTYLGLKLTQDNNNANSSTGDVKAQGAGEGLGGCKEEDLSCGGQTTDEGGEMSQEARATEIKNVLTNSDVDPSLLEEPTDGSYSPQYHAYQWLVVKDPAQLNPQHEDVAQRFALATFYFSTSGGETTYEDPFGKTTWSGINTWLTSADECEWDGVTCLQTPERIDMEGVSSTPEVSPPDDSDNGPPALRRGRKLLRRPRPTTRSLQGGMEDSNSDGAGGESEVSDGVELMEALSNPFGTTSSQGVVSELSLSEKGLTLGIPSQLALLPNLEVLDLSNNNLSLELPNELFLMLPKLKVLRLQNNAIVGTIPPSLSSNKHQLEEINLSGNDDLEGGILEDVCQSDSKTIVLPENGKVTVCSCCTTDDGESYTSSGGGDDTDSTSTIPEKEETDGEVPPLLPPVDEGATNLDIMHVATAKLSAYNPSSTFTGTGTVAIYQHPLTDELWIKLHDVTGVPSECTSDMESSNSDPYACGVAIMTGTECNGDDMVVGEPLFYGSDSSALEETTEVNEMAMITNPWDGTTNSIRYEIENVPSVDVTSRTNSLLTLPSPGNGLSIEENSNRAFVVFDQTGSTRLLCGVLGNFDVPQLTTSPSSTTSGVAGNEYSIMTTVGGVEIEKEDMEDAATTSVTTTSISSMEGGIQLYPGSDYEGDIQGDVTVFIEEDEGDEESFLRMWINVNITGASPDCVASGSEYPANGCGLHIHEGTNCDIADDVGGHYWNVDSIGEADPWEFVRYNSDSEGTIEDVLVVNNGYGLTENVGHVMVVHDTEGGRIGCAVLQFTSAASSGTSTTDASTSSSSSMILLTSQLAPPMDVDSESSVLPEGEIQLTIVENDDEASIPSMNLLFAYSSGLPPNCNSDAAASTMNACQIQIHESNECTLDAIQSNKLYWNPDALEAAGIDTTLPETWFVYTTDDKGATSSDQFNLMLEGGNGYLLEDNVDRSLVVYDIDGSVAYCGVLQFMEGPGEPFTPEYPGMDSSDVPPTVLETVEFQVYPNYSNNDLDLSVPMDGHVMLQFDESGEQLISLSYRFQDGILDCTGTGNTQKNGCGIHIHEGLTCDDVNEIGGHYWNQDAIGENDPWLEVKYVSDSKGMAKDTIELDNEYFMPTGNGYNSKDNVGHALVVHDDLGKPAFCGILQIPPPEGEMMEVDGEGPSTGMPPHESFDRTLEVMTFDFYPGLEDTEERPLAEGEVYIEFDDDTGLGMTLSYFLQNVPPNCDAEKTDYPANGCGIHIHEGTTCDSDEEVGGHYWNTELMGEGAENDMWANVRFTSDAEGNAEGTIELVPDGNGFSMEDNVGRAFVIHDETGSRIYCGLLTSPSVVMELPEPTVLEVTSLDFYPGLEGTEGLSLATGTVNITFDENEGMVLEYDLQNVPSDCLSDNTDYPANGCGIHIHEGTTCDNADDVGGHYWNVESLGEGEENDVWKDVRFDSDSEGNAVGSYSLQPDGNGYDFSFNVGRTLVIHDDTGARIFCGLLSPRGPDGMDESEGMDDGLGAVMPPNEVFDRTLEVTTFGFYPGLEETEDLTLVDGYVGVVFDENDPLKMVIEYSLENVIPNCVAAETSYEPNGCGIHMHEGTSCDEDAGGHYWNQEVSKDDVWVDVRYDSDGEGKAVGSIELPQGNGYPIEENDGRTVVIHDEAGARVYCGLLAKPDLAILPGGEYYETGGSSKPDGGRVPAWDANWIVLGESTVKSDDLENVITSTFGSAVAISGNGRRTIIGDPGANQAFVYEYMFDESTGQSSWQLIGNSLSSPGTDVDEKFGSSVSISDDGNAVAVGGSGDGRVSSNGVVRVYELRTLEKTGDENSTMEWQQIGSDILPSDEELEQNNFEFANAIDMSYNGKIIVIASRYAGAHVLEYNDDKLSGEGAWELVDRTLLPLPDDDETGEIMTELPEGLGISSVSLSQFGDFVAIGVSAKSPLDDSTGSTSDGPGYVQAFKLEDGKWEYHGGGSNGESILVGNVDTYVDGDAVLVQPQSDFGSSVSISGDGQRLAVGAPNAGDERQGLVFTYENGPLEGWAVGWKPMETAETDLNTQLTGDATGDSYGFSVSLSNDGKMLVVGSPMLNSSSSDIGGYARVYMWNPMNDEKDQAWYHVGQQDLSDDSSPVSFGYAVSISSEDGTVAIGAPGQDGSTVGYVNVYVRGSELSKGDSVLPEGAVP